MQEVTDPDGVTHFIFDPAKDKDTTVCQKNASGWSRADSGIPANLRLWCEGCVPPTFAPGPTVKI